MPQIIRGLTLWRPWSHAIAHLGKRVENRDWPPPQYMLGQLLAVHAGRRWDKAGAYQIGLTTGVHLDDLQCPQGIVAVARVRGWTSTPDALYSTMRGEPRLGRVSDWPADDPWFTGPYGWILDDVHALEDPVPCPGSQGLWALPDEVEAMVRGQLKEDMSWRQLLKDKEDRR